MFGEIPSELRWLAGWLRPYVLWHVASFLSISAATVLALAVPMILRYLIDDIIPSQRITSILSAMLCIFVSHVCRSLFAGLANYLTGNAVQRLALDIRLALLRHCDTLSRSYYDRVPTGAVMYSFQEPIDAIAYFGSDLVPSILKTLLAVAFTLITMVILNPRMTIALIPVIPIFVVSRMRFANRLDRQAERVVQTQRLWSSFVQEHFASITSIQLLNKQSHRERWGFLHLAKTAQACNELLRTGAYFTFLTSFSMGLAMSAVIGYGGWNVLTHSLSIGSLVAFYAYVIQLFEPLNSVSETYVRAKKTFATIEFLRSIFEVKSELYESPTPLRLPCRTAANIALHGVRFRYFDGSGQISIPELHFAAGTHVTITGENGAGKSTLAKLLVRLYDVNSGSICVAGLDIRNLEIRNLRERICYAACTPALFHTTIADNLRLANPKASNEEMHEAMQIVGLTKFITSLPNGLSERVGPSGCRLSTGQRQRIGLARCILQRPNILLLDEAMSSLDPESEREIISRMKKLLVGTTVVAISHRLPVIESTDRLIVMKAGEIVRDIYSHP